MNEKITLPALIQLLAIQTGDTRKQSEDFIKEFFNIIASSLADGEQVKIKSLGVFKTISVGPRKSVNVSTGEEHQIPAHRKVVFVPCKEIAALVNEPFEMFDTVELNEKVDLEDIDDVDEKIASDMYPAEEEVQEPEDAEEDAQESVEAEEDIIDNSDVSTREEFVGEENAEQGADKTVQVEEHEGPEIPDADSETSVTEGHVVKMAEIENAVEAKDTDVVYVIDNDTESCEEENSDADCSKLESIPDRGGRMNFEDDEDYDEPESDYGTKTRKFGTGFLAGFISAVVLCGLVFLAVYYVDWENMEFKGSRSITVSEPSVEAVVEPELPFDDIDKIAAVRPVVDSADSGQQENEKQKTVEEGDDKSVAPTQASDQKVYDVISKTRYLTTMAKDHYGNFNLWPYIYIENQGFLGHPDRIKPGTKVVIPSLSKYGVDPSNPDDIAKAKKKGVEIYSKYK